MAIRMLFLLGAAAALVAADITTAHAQSASCQQLESTLATLDRNADFQGMDLRTREARQVGRAVQRSESRYIRDGCNDDAKARRPLTRQCRALAQEITSGREHYNLLLRSIETGQAVAQQREAVLQEIARFGCGERSRARVIRENRGTLFDRLFGGNDSFDGAGGIRADEFAGYYDYHTVRTLCVRKSDGFYWPISYSTLPEYVANDADQCRSQCPGVDVELYYYDNPGQEPEQMINMWGEPYTALPNAFRFRTEVDKENSCKQQIDYGSITLAETENGASRAVIEFGGRTFPLPLRDPRHQAEVTTATLEVANLMQVPLPRPRPAAPGEEPRPVPLTPASAEPVRIVKFGDKRVRIVGPETPYAPSAATGT